jgi:hypothetical protein
MWSDLARHHRLQLGAPGRVAAAVVHEDVQGVAHRGQRVAQLVGEHRQELVLASRGQGLGVAGLFQLQDVVAQLVLALAPAQGAAQRGHQRRDPHRPFEQGDVAQGADGVAQRDRVGAAAGHDQHRQVRPARLLLQRAHQHRVRAVLGQRFLRHHHRAGAAADLAVQIGSIRAQVAGDAVAPQQLAGEVGVARRRQQQQDPLPRVLRAAPAHCPALSPAGPSRSCGTPVRIPRKSESGSPMLMPSRPMRSSRMVRSCAPVRFFSTEIAWRTAPRDSK